MSDEKRVKEQCSSDGIQRLYEQTNDRNNEPMINMRILSLITCGKAPKRNQVNVLMKT